jgi:hypothetical protein
MLRWLVRADFRTDDIEAARKWQLELYRAGKLDKLFKTDETLRCSELQKLTKQVSIAGQ